MKRTLQVLSTITAILAASFFLAYFSYESSQPVEGAVINHRLIDINKVAANSTASYLTVTPDSLYYSFDDGVHGSELWRSDGTEEGTQLVKDINWGMESSFPQYLTNISGVMYFSATNLEQNYGKPMEQKMVPS